MAAARSSTAILAISGSLKRSSINSAVLRAAASAAAQDGIEFMLDDSIRWLPHFDPDLESHPPARVISFREACRTAAGVLIAVPEYAFGIPGAFKNALDWTVGSGSLYRKPMTVLNVAPPGRGAHVRVALDLVLTALDADVEHREVPVSQRDRDASGEVTDRLIIDELRRVVAELSLRAEASPTGVVSLSAPTAQTALRGC